MLRPDMVPDGDLAVAVRDVFDVTERRPIPKGSVVSVEDYDGCADLFVVEHAGRIYLATPDELRPVRPRLQKLRSKRRRRCGKAGP